MEFVPILVLGALALKLVDFFKYLVARRFGDALTQVCVWLGGIIAVVLFAKSDFGAAINIADHTLASMNLAALMILGLTIGSVGSFGYDVKKAVDNSDSAKTPAMFGSLNHHPTT